MSAERVYRPFMSKDEGLLFDNVSRGVPDHDSRYPARVVLVVLGALAVIAGVWMIIAGNARLAYDNTVNDYNVSMGGLGVGNPGGDWWLIGWGIGLLAVGVILVVARLIIAAAQR